MNEKKDKIVINGAPPKWEDSEYQRRLEMDLNVYHLTTASRERVRESLPHAFLEAVTKKVHEGYQVCHRYSVTTDPLDYTCFLIKPESLQDADIADIKVKVKAEYVEWLQSEHSRYQDLLRNQLIQAHEEKERKAIEAAAAKKLAQIDKEVANCYTPLLIPE